MGERFDLVVVGAGPAGLSHAFWRLRESPELRVCVVEADDRAGGWVRTEQVGGFTLEHGPQALRPGPALDALVAALGMQREVIAAAPSARLRHVGRDGRLHPVPTSLGGFVRTPLLPLAAKLRLLREPWVRGRDAGATSESTAAFAERRFGKHVVPLVQAVVSGIFAGDAGRLEVQSAFPTLAGAERERGSIVRGLMATAKAARAARGGAPREKRPALVTFDGGLSALTDRLARVLGPRLRLRSSATALAHGDGGWRVRLADGGELEAAKVLCACPARVTARLVEPLDPLLAAELATIPFASLCSVYFDLDAARATPSMRGFGFLLQPDEGSPVLGGLSCSDVFPHQAPAGRFLVRVMMGGVRQPGLVDEPDDALVRTAETTYRRYTGYAGECRVLRVQRARAAIPQYEIGHVARLARMRDRLDSKWPGLLLRGNSYRGIAVTSQLGEPTTDAV